MKKRKILLVAGARPNFVKIAPLAAVLKKFRNLEIIILHTGQHYDSKMSRVFFNELKIPKPDMNLGIGSAGQAEQTARIMIAFDQALEKIKPELVVVVGDVNSTVACSLASAQRGIKVAHVEAGLRSFDWTMPEEINRVVTDRLSDFLFCTEPSALANLRQEGVDRKKIFFVGNVMIDTLRAQEKIAEKSPILKELHLGLRPYAVVTLHRPGNVDDRKNLQKIMAVLKKIARKMEVVFPVHPRTQKNLKKWNIDGTDLMLIEPLGYIDFLKLIKHADAVLTDSGGIQEETTILGVPCLTLRENTERPITVQQGTNRVVGLNEKKILSAVEKIIRQPIKKLRPPKFWDGKAAERIARILNKHL